MSKLKMVNETLDCLHEENKTLAELKEKLGYTTAISDVLSYINKNHEILILEKDPHKLLSKIAKACTELIK